MRGWTVFFQLIGCDIKDFIRGLRVEFTDTLILFFTNVMALGYLLQQEGAPAGYAAFFVVGAIATFGFIAIVGKVAVFLADMEGDKTLFHTLVMPISSSMVFYYIATSWAVTSIFLSALLIPVGKLFVFTQWNWEVVSIWKLALMLISSNFFFAFFALWLSSVVKMTSLNSLWRRYIAPMWLLGGYTYAWSSMYNLSPTFAYISLVNPMIYVTEGMRAAALGPEGYLPFWLCLPMLWLFTFVCAKVGVKRLKRKLDCV